MTIIVTKHTELHTGLFNYLKVTKDKDKLMKDGERQQKTDRPSPSEV